MIDLTTIQPILSAAFGSGVIAYYWYINNQVDPTKPTADRFDPTKLIPAVLTGAIIGTLSVMFGVDPLTNANVGVQMVAYGLITSVIETGGKTLFRYVADYKIAGYEA